VGRPRPERLVSVLRNVCRGEGLFATQDGLQAVAERCGGDVRASINLLQTSARIMGPDAATNAVRLTADVVRALPLGVVDDQRSALDTWDALICGGGGGGGGMGGGRKRGGRGTGGSWSASPAAMLEDLSHRSPDAGLLLDGLLMNAVAAMDGDVMGSRTTAALQWLSLGDVWANVTAPYFAGTVKFVAVTAVGASVQARAALQGRRVRMAWPRELRGLDAQLRASLATATSVLEHRKGRLGVGARLVRPLVLDVVSPLLDIASPPLEARSMSVLSSRDKRTLSDVAHALASWSLSYTLNRTWVARSAMQPSFLERLEMDDDVDRDRDARIGGGDDLDDGRLRVLRDDSGATTGASADGRPKWVLEPDVERFVRFRGYNPREHGARALCSDIAREVIGDQARYVAVRSVFQRRHLAAPAHPDPSSSSSSSALPDHIQRQVDSANRRKQLAKPSDDSDVPQAAAHPSLAAEDGPPPQKGQGFLASFAAAARARETKRQQQQRSSALTVSQQHVNTLAAKAQHAVTFRFQEGFTNAVRRPASLADFTS
jgi:hypothetical protein